MKDMCAECGADLRETDQRNQTTAVVAMVHNIPELMVSMKVWNLSTYNQNFTTTSIAYFFRKHN